jgi:hypothetical protein
VRLSEVFALVLSEGDAAKVLRILSKPLGDLEVRDPIAHLLVDGLDEWATADVAPSQDWCEVSHYSD